MIFAMCINYISFFLKLRLVIRVKSRRSYFPYRLDSSGGAESRERRGRGPLWRSCRARGKGVCKALGLTGGGRKAKSCSLAPESSSVTDRVKPDP